MHHVAFDTIAREAARRISRRASLGALSAAGLAAVGAFAGALPATAKKGNRKKRRTKRGGNNIAKKANQKCAQQETQCFDEFKDFCTGGEDCALDAFRCCPVAGACDIVGFLLCLDEQDQ